MRPEGQMLHVLPFQAEVQQSQREIAVLSSIDDESLVESVDAKGVAPPIRHVAAESASRPPIGRGKNGERQRERRRNLRCDNLTPREKGPKRIVFDSKARRVASGERNARFP